MLNLPKRFNQPETMETRLCRISWVEKVQPPKMKPPPVNNQFKCKSDQHSGSPWCHAWVNCRRKWFVRLWLQFRYLLVARHKSTSSASKIKPEMHPPTSTTHDWIWDSDFWYSLSHKSAHAVQRSIIRIRSRVAPAILNFQANRHARYDEMDDIRYSYRAGEIFSNGKLEVHIVTHSCGEYLWLVWCSLMMQTRSLFVEIQK